MPLSDVLKTFRQEGYGAKDEGEDSKESEAGPRMISLTEEEVKSLEPYQVKPGEEIVLEVSGKLEGDHFHILSAKYASGGGEGSGDQNEMAAAVMGKAPMMQSQTMPSPS